MIEYNEKTAKKIERNYITPEMAHQRIQTLAGLVLQPDEHVLDAGCGTGFLTEELAIAVGPNGRVVGIDNSLDMLALAARRCKELPQVQLKKGSVEKIPEKDNSFDAVSCVQVLLYVHDVSKALGELHRVLKRGGRVVLLETDWRGVVLNSSDEILSQRMFAAWDDAVPSPNLPVQLAPLLRAQGFTAVRVEPVPLLNTSYMPDNFAVDTLKWVAHYAREQGAVSEEEAVSWLADFVRSGEKNEFFFCVNRFLFSAVKL
ncbi:methyltransferase domain-containing protein [Desulforhopalus vacuolatus]|uniref:methyltransferase domain-containing protein n=1 Tax=Desulforhopalus vacuolatus TaxID=40414 RepID=UPI001965A676|nr:methyltransferase domain-containing protein [Desulforhopalus vacuolatus]MBM9518598.1 methyltransferase domain-containing protein [Desulforhopalus vacuolatus]